VGLKQTGSVQVGLRADHVPHGEDEIPQDMHRDTHKDKPWEAPQTATERNSFRMEIILPGIYAFLAGLIFFKFK